jgi:translation elongation factor EF-1beta
MSDKKQKKCAATFSVLPADNEIDLEVIREKVRGITKDSLVWGQGSIEPFVFGLQKLVISSCFVMDLVNVNDLQEEIENFPEVQSVSIDDTTEV